MRIAVCLGRTRQWDRALDTTLAFLQEHRETLWEPRALVWSAALYEALPESAYRSGTRILFDGERSTAQQGGVPEHVYLREQIRRSRHEALEAARIFYQRYRGAAGLEAEQVQLNYALIRSLDEQSALARWGAGKEWLPPTDSLWRVDTSVPYDPGWPAPLQYLYLYRQIQDLAEQVEPGGRRGDLARLAEAVWLQRYHSWMNGVARRPIKEGDPPSEWRRIPYPYQDRDPLLLYRR
ncbi:MAG: hypothetical protein FJX77_17105, partial [Armatimonadetes bacterium]|nr:hypothetical protein [Armatimonadota bacterium]